MSSKDKNLSDIDLSKCPSASGMKIAIAVSEWNGDITDKLLKGCIETLEELGIQSDDCNTVHVPGSFELPSAAKLILKHSNPDAVICLGCVIKGETSHDEYINMAVANGVTQLSLLSGKPIIFGVLTVNSMEQALDRAGGQHGNKGVECAVTAVRMIDLNNQLGKPKSSIGY